jgi:hypothetical protein
MADFVLFCARNQRVSHMLANTVPLSYIPTIYILKDTFSIFLLQSSLSHVKN